MLFHPSTLPEGYCPAQRVTLHPPTAPPLPPQQHKCLLLSPLKLTSFYNASVSFQLLSPPAFLCSPIHGGQSGRGGPDCVWRWLKGRERWGGLPWRAITSTQKYSPVGWKMRWNSYDRRTGDPPPRTTTTPVCDLSPPAPSL